ncbi:efflux RND transporter periplasmic adaptor subunit [Gallaecimonas sp. GXIMD4217]|uniref:efflux RND transporter periplasmic adaptor subunit n=1 Tax=Gallaecimonas sp. GXIMD4217 TaxID=3131927 RepID=UPI00311B0E4D
MKPQLPTLSAITLALLLSACSSGEAKDVAQEEKPKEEVLIPVSVAEVKVAAISARYQGHATLEAESDATVVARVSGLVEAIQVEEGDEVSAGQVLALIEPRRYQLERDKLAAETRSVAQELERLKKMQAKKLVSAETVDKLSLRLESAKASLALAELDLQYAAVKAPISGVVSRRHVKAGHLARADEALFDIVQHDVLRAEVAVPEHYLAPIRQAKLAQLRFAALPGDVFEARVSRVSPVVDAATGTTRVTLHLNNPQGLLLPGMFAEVDIQYDTHEQARLVPRQAVINQGETARLFVIGQENVAELREVTLGYGDNDWVEVLKGLDEGEQVVTLGQHHLKDQAKVEVIKG